MKIQLDFSSSTPLPRQIYAHLRGQILAGELSPGARLPPSRKLAKQLGVARLTVMAALDQLKTEGYLTGTQGAGTFVAKQLPNLAVLPQPHQPKLSRWGERMKAGDLAAPGRSTPHTDRAEIDFGFGRAFATIFPYAIWRRLLSRYLSTDDALLSRYGSPAGFDPLRTAVADYLTRMRGVKCTAEQVAIVSGTQQALDILARLLLPEGASVVVETPGYPSAFKLFQAYGATLVPVPVDASGFDPAFIPAHTAARLAFVTPSNQFPHGGFMNLRRRLALLAWARSADATIIEDDYDGELRYDGYPLAALQGLDIDGRVVYLGTFSKVLFPALRLGYVVLPAALREPFLQAKQLMDRGAPTLTQAAVADFILEGHFERHLRRLRKVYGERRALLTAALTERLGDLVSFSQDNAGLQIMLYLPPTCDEAAVVQEAAAVGVAVYPGFPYHLVRPARPSILLGFSGLTEAEVLLGVERLAEVILQLEGESLSAGNKKTSP